MKCPSYLFITMCLRISNILCRTSCLMILYLNRKTEIYRKEYRSRLPELAFSLTAWKEILLDRNAEYLNLFAIHITYGHYNFRFNLMIPYSFRYETRTKVGKIVKFVNSVQIYIDCYGLLPGDDAKWKESRNFALVHSRLSFSIIFPECSVFLIQMKWAKIWQTYVLAVSVFRE